MPSEGNASSGDGELKLAVVGRPNVGKSSLVNALLGEERTLVSQTPGTTRDAIDAPFAWHEREYRLVDTAGMLKKPEAHGAIEYYAALRALNAIARCDIALLVFDAMTGIMAQDRRLAGIAIEEGKGLILVGNKWDLVREQTGDYTRSDLSGAVHDAAPFAAFAPVTFLSAKTKRRLGSLMPVIAGVAENLDRRLQTSQLNALVRDAVLAHPPAFSSGKVLRIFYAAQVATHPPRFLFHCNDPDLVQSHYKRFLENVIRRHFDFTGVPLSLEFRPRREPDEASE